MDSKIHLYSYSRCTTCRKAIKWLEENKVDYQLIDITENPPSKKILQNALEYLGDRKFLFNTSGLSYREIGSKVVKAMSNDEALLALSSDGKLIKRPFLIIDQSKYLVGFNSDLWRETILR